MSSQGYQPVHVSLTVIVRQAIKCSFTYLLTYLFSDLLRPLSSSLFGSMRGRDQ